MRFLFYPHIKRMIATTGFLYTLLISSLYFEETGGLGQKMFKQEEMLQPKIYEKQENRSKSGEIGEMIQSERVENQADWG